MGRWALVLLVVAGVAGWSASGRAELPGYNGRIVFVGPTGLLQTYDPMTQQVGPVAGRQLHGAMPSWSPDGHLIAFVAGRTGQVGQRPEIDVVDVGSGDVTRITGGLPGGTDVASPSWSPDGRRLVFVCRGLGICVVGRDGGNLGVVSAAAATGVAWSPDGTKLAYSIETLPAAPAETWQEGLGLWVAAADGSDAKRIWELPGGVELLGPPSWSPDGKWLAAEPCEDSERSTLLVLRADGTAVRDLPSVGEVCEDRVAWSPDGAKLVLRAFPGPNTGDSALVQTDVDGRNLRPLLDPATSKPLLGRSPDWERRESPAQPPPRATAPAVRSRPVIGGRAVVGSTLTVTTGEWSGDLPITFTSRWQRCDAAGNGCSPIVGATTSSYEVTAADAGFRLRVAVTARNAAGSATADSDATGPVQRVNAPPVIRSARLAREQGRLRLRLTVCDDDAGAVAVHATDWNAVGGRQLDKRRHVWRATVPNGCRTLAWSWTPVARRHALHPVAVRLRDADGGWSRRVRVAVRIHPVAGLHRAGAAADRLPRWPTPSSS